MILFSAKISSKHHEKLKHDYSDQQFLFSDSDEMTKKHLDEAEVLVTYGSDVNEEVIQHASKLKWIMVLSAGVDELPFELMKEKEIILTNARGIHKIQMAEYAISMLLQVYRQEKILIQNEQAHHWDKSVKVKEITGSTIVIAGTGAIGQEVARLAKAFQMKTIGVSRSGANVAYFDENVTNDKLEHVLPEADFLVSVLPRTKETKGFFTYDHFNVMPDHGVFLNMGRGDAVSSEVMLQAVQENEIAHAILDVTEQEPLPKDHPFWSEDKITITPHISGLSPHYATRALEIFRRNLDNYLTGGDDYTNKIDLSRGY
ncbi:D-2-hydroxyacid dehydrogenase [Oceanobacillus polygoni]|uniref:Phosphoglycerate dehydrogenase-like enzyme n=1 Tax=Oceanobacillus polygoni TaxID=1235259 RepID=A0A9X0YU50_9BACI|nr:D-2-hydroxyacid dehydrogenase [Oceanobacillus polygoni]MBP2078679.1 phosphoglycerate dehydrogenase-like enzyme [Oceanobacillus polygoni]